MANGDLRADNDFRPLFTSGMHTGEMNHIGTDLCFERFEPFIVWTLDLITSK